jgi:tripartite-type tricarboxylate transporter receptor subunit TctC
VQERFHQRGVEPRPGDAAALGAFLRAEMEKWLPILRATDARSG